MNAKELDEKFDAGEDISFCLDLSKATRANQQQKRIIEKINTLKNRVI
ncbi:MAG TPA: hypothetical protein VK469_05505 [Candidatus Kapabacteria bacterium]|nr:hypothetical protein [Candidatus Kapabacteria bacterium]